MKKLTLQIVVQLNIYTPYNVKTKNADQVFILHIINMILYVNIDSGFNPLGIPRSCFSGRACPQFALTSGLHISSSDHAAASSQTTAEPGAQIYKGDVKTYNLRDRCIEKGTHYWYFTCDICHWWTAGTIIMYFLLFKVDILVTLLGNSEPK